MKTIIQSLPLVLIWCGMVDFAKAAVPDTVIIKTDVDSNGQTMGRVYISPDKRSWQYDSIQSFSLVKNGQGSKQFPYGGWISLSQYNGKYTLYYPCDLGNLYRIEITKSKVREYRTETEDYTLTAIKRIDDRRFTFNITGEGGVTTTMRMSLIDKNKGVAILEFVDAAFGSTYQLLLAANHAKDFPLIIYDCNVKGDEMRFEKIDYAMLLKGHLK